MKCLYLLLAAAAAALIVAVVHVLGKHYNNNLEKYNKEAL
jgi:cell division protein FtsL